MSYTTERRGSDGLTKQERASLREPSLWEVEQMTARQFVAHHRCGEEMTVLAFRDGSFSVVSNTGSLYSVDHALQCECVSWERFMREASCCKHTSACSAVERFLTLKERAAAKAQAEIDAEFDTAAAAREASREQTRREQAAEQAERTRKVGQELAEIFGG